MYCRKCGNEIAEGEKFCAECGTPVETENNVEAESNVDNRKKSNKKWIPIILVLLLFVAGGSGTVIYFTSAGYKIGKNEKLAAKCMEEENYKEAISYYKTILQLDDSREDAYYNIAECYMNLEKTEKAIEILEDGVKACKKDKDAKERLLAKDVDCYQKLIEEYAVSGNYSEAYSAIENGYQNTKAEEILNVKAEIFQLESDSYNKAGNYGMAAEVLLRGINEVGDDTLVDKMMALYMEQVDALVNQSSYDEALEVLKNGISATGDTAGTLFAKEADVYQAKSNEALKAGDCMQGLQILEEGEEALGNGVLAEREAYVKEHILALPEKVAGSYDDKILYYICEYDEAGHLIKKTAYDYDGVASGRVITYLYDADGNRIQENSTDGSQVSYEYEFDSNGNITKRIADWGGSTTEEIEYNASGQIVKQIIISSDDGTTWEFDYTYAQEGYLSKEEGTTYEGEDKLIMQKYEAQYDEKGNVLNSKDVYYDGYGEYDKYDEVRYSYEYEYTYEYDGNRCLQQTMTERYDDGEEENVYESITYYEYDNDGRVTSYIHDGDREYYNYGATTVEVDDQTGNYQPLDGEMEYQYDGSRYNMYTYDQFGNKIYSVAFGPMNLSGEEEAALSYIYRYVGEE